MAHFLSQLVELSLKNIEAPPPQSSATWFLISDQVTQIKGKGFSSLHPCLVLSKATIQTGRIDVWIRSTTRHGSVPEYLPHLPHAHGTISRCALDREGSVSIRYFKSIPASHLLRLNQICSELDKEWLLNFQKCYFTIFNSWVVRE
jgi:hypothetical protein